jgi:CheY-like chemotaxis protein
MKTIMVVDDEENARAIIRELLKEEGYKVTEAGNGKEALEKLRKKKADLVLLDFFMPKMSGIDVAEAIKKDPKLKKLKIAFLTVAQFGEEGYKRMRKIKILDYIQKPFDNEDLIKSVKKLVG